MEKGSGYGMAERIPFSSTPTDFDGFRQRLSKILQEAVRLSEIQKEGTARQLPFSGRKADQT